MKKILLTGANGYVGKRLLPELVALGYHVTCCVRDKQRFSLPDSISEYVDIIEVDFLDEQSLSVIPNDIDAAYYLMHSMSTAKDYPEKEKIVATNFKQYMVNTKVEQVIYLSGIINEDKLSQHLASRKAVEEILKKGHYALTTLRAGIIIGSGSASFEIIRDLVEKLPIMIAPRWLLTKCQPISIADVIKFLQASLLNTKTYDQYFDIGGQDVLTYNEMLLGYAEARQLKRWIGIVPVMTAKLSSYWLYFVTSTSYPLASALVSSMHIDVVCQDNKLAQLLDIEPLTYQQSLAKAFQRIEGHNIVSSWKDSRVSGQFNINLSEFLSVPKHGCFVDKQIYPVINRQSCIYKIWSIGGEVGWYYATWLWKTRGFIDKLCGGVGLRRGRRNEHSINNGDAIDFWRVLYANEDEGRLLLFAEMKLPGEAWLEFKVKDDLLEQTATFRPRGLWGRLYWYSVSPFHLFIFKGLAKKLSS